MAPHPPGRYRGIRARAAHPLLSQRGRYDDRVSNTNDRGDILAGPARRGRMLGPRISISPALALWLAWSVGGCSPTTVEAPPGRGTSHREERGPALPAPTTAA